MRRFMYCLPAAVERCCIYAEHRVWSSSGTGSFTVGCIYPYQDEMFLS